MSKEVKDYKKYIEYIINAGTQNAVSRGCQIPVKWFVSDWEPIGISILDEMEKMGIIEFVCNRESIVYYR